MVNWRGQCNVSIFLNSFKRLILWRYLWELNIFFHLSNFSKITFYHHRSKRSPDQENAAPVAPSQAPVAPVAPSVVAKTEEEDTKPLRTSKSLDKKLETSESASSTLAKEPRQSRGWCNESKGVFCMIYNAFQGSEEKVRSLINV